MQFIDPLLRLSRKSTGSVRLFLYIFFFRRKAPKAQEKLERQQYNQNNQKSTATDINQHYSYSTPTQKTLDQLGKQRSGVEVSTEPDTNSYHHLLRMQGNKTDKNMTGNHYQGVEIQDTYDHTTDQKVNVAGETYDHLEADDKKSDRKNATKTIPYENTAVPATDVSKSSKADTQEDYYLTPVGHKSTVYKSGGDMDTKDKSDIRDYGEEHSVYAEIKDTYYNV